CFFFGQGLGAVFAHNDKPGCDTDPDLNARLALGIRRPDSANDGQRRADCPLGIVFVGSWITEKRHDAVANVIRDEALELVDRVGAAVIIATRELIEVFGIERLCERCRAHDVAKENREVSSFAAGSEIGPAWRRQPRCRGENIRGPRSNRQADATASAKPTFWRVHSPALNAFGGQCDAALRAEAPTLRIIRVTAQAFHEAVQLLIADACLYPERVWPGRLFATAKEIPSLAVFLGCTISSGRKAKATLPAEEPFGYCSFL